METKKPGFSDERRSDNDNRKSQTSETTPRKANTMQQKETFSQRWSAIQLSKTAIFWTCLAVMAGTMLVGFTWGGWVSGSTAQKTATTTANVAVVDRLASICVAQFQQDPDKDEKLVEMLEASSFQQRTYVKDQGWATMPGDEDSDSKVATACAKLLGNL